VSDPSRFQTISAALLTGGSPTPAGTDASHLLVGGIAGATRLARELGHLFEDVLLVGGDPPSDAPGRRVADRSGAESALRGVVTALEAARTDRVLIVAGNLPLLTPELVLALIAWPEADLVLPRADARPLCGLYRRAPVLPVAQRHLDAERLALDDLHRELETTELGPEEISRIDPHAVALTTVDTPADAEVAEALLAEGT
jgi:molybdopterin-guanine dinucleotide biosynthesis protein A